MNIIHLFYAVWKLLQDSSSLLSSFLQFWLTKKFKNLEVMSIEPKIICHHVLFCRSHCCCHVIIFVIVVRSTVTPMKCAQNDWEVMAWAVADLHTKVSGAPPQQDQILSFLHVFLLKSSRVGGWRPLQWGLAPPNGKSWIRPCNERRYQGMDSEVTPYNMVLSDFQNPWQ